MGAAAAPIAAVSSIASIGMSFASSGMKMGAAGQIDTAAGIQEQGAGLQLEAAGIQREAIPLQLQAGEYQYESAQKNAEGEEMRAAGTSAEYDFKAKRAMEAAKFGRLQAGLTDVALREQLNVQLANIDAIRAGGNVDPTSPTGAAIAGNEAEKSDRVRMAAGVTSRAQIASDEAGAAYLRKVGEYALLTGKRGAEAIILGGKAALEGARAGAKGTEAQAKAMEATSVATRAQAAATRAQATATRAAAVSDIASGLGKVTKGALGG